MFYVSKVEQGWGVFANDQLIKTPRDRPWIVPTEELGAALAAEWCQQEPGKINWRTMPLGQLAQTVLDIAPAEEASIVADILRYIDSETLCHRADHPRELAEQQEQLWNPILDWFAGAYHTAWQIGSGVMPVPQSTNLKQTMERALHGMDDFHLVGVRHATQACGSLVLALALMTGHLCAQTCYEAAEIESRYQADRWGADEEAEKRLSALWADIALCHQWFRLLSPESEA